MKRYKKYIAPYKGAFICGPILMLTEVAGEIALPKLMSMIINNGVANRDTGYTITLVRQSGDTALEYVRNDRKRTGVDTAFYNAKVETDGTYVLFLNNAASDPYADMRIQARDVQAKLRVRQIRDENGDPVTEDWSAYTTQGNREYHCPQ